jgi:ABC-type transport system substrate-binding protein
MVGSWDKGQKLVLDRNPNYWDSEEPYLDSVTFQVVPDSQTQILQLRSGQTDMLLNVPTSSAKSLEGQSGVNLLTHSGGATNEVIFNTLVPPFDKQTVRQAMYFALDRQAIIDSGLFGFGDVPTDLFPPYMEQHDSDAPEPVTDTDKAKELLAEAGYDDSNPLSFELKTINTSDFINQATVIKDQLNAIGVQVQVTPMEKGAFLAPMFREEGTDPKSWQAGLERYSFTSDPQSFSWEQYAKDSAINASNINLPGGNQAPELEKVVNATLAAPDLESAKKLYAQELEILNTVVPDVRISYQMNVQATTSRVHGYQALSGNQFPLRLVWVS